MGLGLLAPIATGVLGFLGGQDQRGFEAAQAQKQMDFQERMSSTAYQRAVHDMKMAGINPALAYNQGGATSPSGAMATTSDVISPAVSGAMQAMRMVKELDQLDRQNALLEAQKHKTDADTEASWQESYGPKPGIDPRTDSYVVQRNRAQADYWRKQAALSGYAMPGSELTGSKVWQVLQLLFGGGGAISGAKNLAQIVTAGGK